MPDAFELDGDLISEDKVTKELAMKVYEAIYRGQDGNATTKYFQGDRLLDAATKASDVVSGDPFNTLIEVKELGTLN